VIRLVGTLQMSFEYRPFVIMGLMLILFGILLVLLPLIAKYAPTLERLPPFLVYIYHRDGFYFATSPLLILISLILIFAYILSRG
jgi:hypothetical protein